MYLAKHSKQSFHFAVAEFSQRLHKHIEACRVSKSKVHGVNKEESQAKFYALMASTDGVLDLTAVTGSRQLTMWLCVNAVDLLSPSAVDSTASVSPAAPLTAEEVDITHYIGGFVVRQLKKRNSGSGYRDVIDTIISSDDPDSHTLLAVKSRGGLLNLTTDGKALFAELEHIFRELFPPQTVHLSVSKYSGAVTANCVVQDCYHNSSASVDSSQKDKVLMDIIALYFKVRVHHKCKLIVEKVRNKKRDATKEKALRSKLAK